jgi:hypothetical protein
MEKAVWCSCKTIIEILMDKNQLLKVLVNPPTPRTEYLVHIENFSILPI